MLHCRQCSCSHHDKAFEVNCIRNRKCACFLSALFPTLLLRKDFLLPPEARDSLNNRVKEGHLENTRKTKHEKKQQKNPYFIFTLRNSLSSTIYQSNAFQHRCMWRLMGGCIARVCPHSFCCCFLKWCV